MRESTVMQKSSVTTSIIAILSFILGAWLIFDSTRKLVTGYYTGEQTIGLGPWATIVSALGVRPADLAFPFLFLGVIWIVNGVIVLLGTSTRYERTIAISIVTLFYALPGTLIGILNIFLSLREKRLAKTLPLTKASDCLPPRVRSVTRTKTSRLQSQKSLPKVGGIARKRRLGSALFIR